MYVYLFMYVYLCIYMYKFRILHFVSFGVRVLAFE